MADKPFTNPNPVYTDTHTRDNIIIIIIIILTANGYLPGGSGTIIRHNTQITNFTQNNTTIKRKTAHKTTKQ
jgi:hypothetical protein